MFAMCVPLRNCTCCWTRSAPRGSAPACSYSFPLSHNKSQQVPDHRAAGVEGQEQRRGGLLLLLLLHLLLLHLLLHLLPLHLLPPLLRPLRPSPPLNPLQNEQWKGHAQQCHAPN